MSNFGFQIPKPQKHPNPRYAPNPRHVPIEEDLGEITLNPIRTPEAYSRSPQASNGSQKCHDLSLYDLLSDDDDFSEIPRSSSADSDDGYWWTAREQAAWYRARMNGRR